MANGLDWYYKNREKAKEYFRAYGVKNREKRAEYRRKYYATISGKLAVKRAVKKYELAHPKRHQAWYLANKIYKKYNPCFVCGKFPTHKHHPDINKPLEVIYLCPLHHKQTDAGVII